MNSGPRFVMHADNEARNNWRDPVERLGGPAVNAWRILNARVRCPARMIHRRPCTARADLTKERELVTAEHIGAAVGAASVESCIALIVIYSAWRLVSWFGKTGHGGRRQRKHQEAPAGALRLVREPGQSTSCGLVDGFEPLLPKK